MTAFADWLRAVLPVRYHRHLGAVAIQGARFDFWPTLPGGAEPDVVIHVGSLLIVIEAKYGAQFGNRGGRHQLAIEWHQGHRMAMTDALEGPVVVAVTDDLVQPTGVDVARAQLEPVALSAAGLTAADAVVWCSWQSVAKVIDAIDKDEWRTGDHAIVGDLFELMQSRGVRFVYEGFKTADWWLLAAAADAATERVYPTVAEFAREITAQGASRGLVWGGNDSGVVWYESKRLAQTEQWHRHYIQLPLLHKNFGRRLSHYCALYVLFTFNQPAIRAGWWFQPRKQSELIARAAGIAAWLDSRALAFDVIESTPWHHVPLPVEQSRLTADWLQQPRPGSDRWFRVERTWAPESITSTAPVIDVLTELATSLCDDGSVLDALEADGTLDRSQASIPVPLAIGDDVADSDEDGGGDPDGAAGLGSTA